jgi:PAS domain S-box-containing protein
MTGAQDTAVAERPSVSSVPLPGLLAGYLVAYVAIDWLSYIYPVAPLAITVWNPPPGLSLALLLRAGLAKAPALFVAALVADVVIRSAPGPAWFALVSYAVTASGYTLAAAWLLKVARIDSALRRVQDVAWLLVTAVAGSGLVAVAYVALNVVAGLVPREDLARFVVRFWVGDAIGILVATPLILVFVTWGKRQWPSGTLRASEVLLQVAGLAAALFVVVWWAHPAEASLFYLLFVPVIWIAMRHGLRGATVAMMVVQIVLIGVLWARGNPLETVLQFQTLLLALTGTALLVAAAVDERARSRAQLAEREEDLRTVVETAPDGIVTLDRQGRVREANAAAGAMLGVTPESLRGRPLESLLGDATRLEEGSAETDRTARRADGTPFPVEVSMAEAGGSGLRIAVLRDVSQRREAEERSRRRQEELSRALRLAAAGEMSSALAHELNQPLSAIANYAKACRLLADSGDQARLRETLSRMGIEIGRASEVVRRLRDFFRTGAVRLEPIFVADVVRAALESSLARLQRHGIVVRTSIPELSPNVIGDRVQLEVVIHNLIANSIDALAPVDASRREVSIAVVPRGSEVEVVVQDSGPGVPVDLMAELFTPFVTSKADGMGLGLAISRYLAEAHGGRLWAEPLPEGTVFRLALPVDGGRDAPH